MYLVTRVYTYVSTPVLPGILTYDLGFSIPALLVDLQEELSSRDAGRSVKGLLLIFRPSLLFPVISSLSQEEVEWNFFVTVE